MFFWWIHVFFRSQGLEGPDDAKARVPGFDHIINISVTGSIVWIGKLVLVFILLLNDEIKFLLIVGHFFQFFLIEDFDRAFGPHYCNFSRGPRIV